VSLTEEQWQAVKAGGSVAVVAGAGTGKTHMLTERYLHHLSEDSYSPLEVVAVTFTNKATDELRIRVRERVREHMPEREDVLAELKAAQISTIHALCALVCQEHPEEAGVPADFAVLDELRGGLWRADRLTDALDELSNDHYGILPYPLMQVALETLLADPIAGKHALERALDGWPEDWESLVAEVRRGALERLLLNPELKESRRVLSFYQGSPNDRMEVQRQASLSALSELDEALISDVDAPDGGIGALYFPAICRAFPSEPPRTRTWKLRCDPGVTLHHALACSVEICRRCGSPSIDSARGGERVAAGVRRAEARKEAPITKGRDRRREDNPWNELTKSSFKAAGAKSGRCVYPVEPACTNKPCNAHSIQKGTVLDSLAEEGHVVMLKTDRVDRGRRVRARFKRVGCNDATTFAGLCAQHDAELFTPIDQRTFNLEDSEQLFLLAYRSVLRQAHAIPTAARAVDMLREKKVQLKLLEPEEVAVEGEPVGRLRGDVGPMSEEKRAFDQAYLDGRFEDVEHEIAWTPRSLPSLAVSSFFSIGYNPRSSQQMPVAFNVFPYDGKHAVVFSFRKPSKLITQDLVFGLKQTTGEERFRAVSLLVLKNSDNFVLRPSLYNSFGEAQKQVMRDYFLGTVKIPALGRREIKPVPGLVKDDDVEKLNLFKKVGQ